MPECIYDKPEYWCGEIGYRPPGYSDFVINVVKEIVILLFQPTSVLDVGCAYGYSVDRLNQLGVPTKGIDISSLAISRADKGVRPFLTQGVAWDLPYGDKEFDLIYSSGMLEHIEEDKLEKTISEFKRVSNRGLLGIAVTDDESSKVDEDSSHSKLLSIKEWDKLFSDKNYLILSDSQDSWARTALVNIAKICK